MGKIVQCRTAQNNGRRFDLGVAYDNYPNLAYESTDSYPGSTQSIPPLALGFMNMGALVTPLSNFFLFDLQNIPSGSQVHDARLKLRMLSDGTLGASVPMRLSLIDPLNPVSSKLFRAVGPAPNVLTPDLIDPPPTSINRAGLGRLLCLIRDAGAVIIAWTGVNAGGATRNIPIRRSYVDSKTGENVPYISNAGQLMLCDSTATIVDTQIRIQKTGTPTGDCVIQIYSSNLNCEALTLLGTATAAWSGLANGVNTLTFASTFDVTAGDYVLAVISSTSPYSDTDFANLRFNNLAAGANTRPDEDMLLGGIRNGYSPDNFAARSDYPFARSQASLSSGGYYITPFDGIEITQTQRYPNIGEYFELHCTQLLNSYIRSPAYRGLDEKLVGVVIIGVSPTTPFGQIDDWILQVNYTPPQTNIT